MNQYPNGPQPPYDPNGFHSQDTTAGQYPRFTQQPPLPYQQPGQYTQPGPQKPPLPHEKLRLWQWYKRRSKGGKLGVGCATLLGVFLLCGLCSAIANAGNATQQPTQAVIASTPTPEPTIDTSLLSTVLADTPTPQSTPTAIPTPTQAPVVQQPIQQSKPVQQPQPVQQAPPPPAQLFVTFTGASAVDNSSGSVSVHTLPNAGLTISIKYCTGSYATSSSLKGTQYADGNGDHTWSWTPDTKCRGTATAYVTASLNGQSASNSTNFNVS